MTNFEALDLATLAIAGLIVLAGLAIAIVCCTRAYRAGKPIPAARRAALADLLTQLDPEWRDHHELEDALYAYRHNARVRAFLRAHL